MKPVAITMFSALLLAAISCNDSGKTDSAAPAKTDTAKKDTASATKMDAPPPPMDSAAAMKAMADYGTPGEPHKMLAAQDGAWNEEITMWMAPGAPPQTMKASCVNKMIMGGRYQQSVNKGSFNGMPFEGVSTVGYDNAKKVFISNWYDNMGTGMITLEGPWDAATKSVTFKGKEVDPTIGKEIDIKQVMTFIDDKNQKMEMYTTPPGGKEYKSMEIKFTKK